ncbi:MAG: ParB/RepB/Spo0J family partition protein, partial [Elusimicrobiota bacterium]|nr:ParB/RepB/Spo0J family partition protein [Elusimicrobiota bacterium]
TKPPVGETVISIPLSRIKPNKFQPRKKFDDEGLQDLANSINQHGLIQPITVVATVVPGEYELIAGERRFRASKLAGKTDIKAIVRQGTTDKQKMDLALIENIQRENFTPIEEAQAYNRLIEEFKHTHDEIAEVVGKNRSVITNTLRLLSLPEDIQNLIDDGKISSGHGRMLAGIEDEKQMRELVERILIEKLPVRAVEKIVSDIKKQKKPKTEKQLESEIINFKEEIQRKFGTKANVNGTNKKGKIEIFYYSLQDLERIAQELNIQI